MWLAVTLAAVLLAAELIALLVRLRGRKKREQKIRKSLYRFLEERVLNRTLSERIRIEDASREEAAKYFLCVEFPDTKPLVTHLFSLDSCVTIGRNRENIICIRDESLSRMHCKIYCSNGYLLLQDMGTTNGTKIRRGLFGRIQLGGGNQAYLQNMDTLVLGNYRMRIRLIWGGYAEI